MLEKKPSNWMEKLTQVNARTLSMVWSKQTCSLANPSYIKKATKVVNGELQFVQGSGKGYQLIHLNFKPSSEDPSGPGVYWLFADGYPARAVCCVNSSAERSGFDLLREAYAGQTQSKQMTWE